MRLKSYPSSVLFFGTLVVGLVAVASSDNWFMCWVGLELTLLGFVPQLVAGSVSLESSVKYFLVQAGGSVLLVASFMVSYGVLFVSGVCLKLGLAPFYHWVPGVASAMSPANLAILLTLQKVAPLVMAAKAPSSLLAAASFFSVLVGGLGGTNQSNMLPLISYSSIAHTGWLGLGLFMSLAAAALYFFAYCASVVVIFSLISSGDKVFKLNMRWALAALLLNLSGLPPMPLFLGKLAVAYMLLQAFPLVGSLVVLSSSVTIYMYVYCIIPASG